MKRRKGQRRKSETSINFLSSFVAATRLDAVATFCEDGFEKNCEIVDCFGADILCWLGGCSGGEVQKTIGGKTSNFQFPDLFGLKDSSAKRRFDFCQFRPTDSVIEMSSRYGSIRTTPIEEKRSAFDNQHTWENPVAVGSMAENRNLLSHDYDDDDDSPQLTV